MGLSRFHPRDALTVGKDLKIAESQIEGAGLGLFAMVPLSKNQFITRYEGPVITHEETKKLKSVSHVRSLSMLRTVIVGIEDPQLVQGKGGGSFANDARNSHFDNNAIFVRKSSDGEDAIFIRAKRDIAVGEEIFVSYGRTYWKRFEEETQVEEPSLVNNKKRALASKEQQTINKKRRQ